MFYRYNYEDFLKTKKINEKALLKYFIFIFDDLYQRVENNKAKDGKISMETMRLFFQYPELIFKLICTALNISIENRISKDQFLEIIFKLYCSEDNEKMKFYFNIFSPNEKQLINCKNIELILFNFHLINYSNNFNYLNKIINNLNLKENMSFSEWEELNSRNSDLFYLMNFYIEDTKPFNDYLINDLFINEIKNNIIKNEFRNNNLQDKITKNFKLYLNSLKKEKDDLFFNDLSLYNFKAKTKDFYDEDISNKNNILDISNINIKKIQTSKSYSNLRMNNLLLHQYDNMTITGNSSTQCEDDYQFLHHITSNKSSLISSQNIIQIPINKFIKAFLYSKNEKKFIEKEIDIIDNVIIVYSEGIVNQIIDLRYSFIETNLSKVKHKEKHYQRIYIIAKFSNFKNNAFKLFFDSNFEYENFLSKIPTKDLYSTFIKNYEIKELIGIGGFGKVYKVLNNETGETLAVKVINKKEINYNERVSSYKNEIFSFNMLTHINHENIIKAIELYENCENICCIYEYIPQNLTQFILCNKNNFNVNIIKKISYQIICALNFMKKIGLIHQDLKSENVMVKYDNNINNLNIKLIDFGLSKIILNNETCNGQFGTPNYMAPELTYYDDYNYKIDIWSLGIILYYLKFNKLPFDDDSKLKDKILKNIKYQRIRFGNSICKFENNDEKIFQNIILNCLIRNPDDRISIESLSENQWFHI